MDGYDVVSVDDQKIGKVVGETGLFLIVEQGALLMSKHPLPREFAHIDDDFNEQVAAEYYGIALSPGPGTEGYGVSEAGDPSRSSEEQAARQDVEPAVEERAQIREGEEQSGLPESSPALLGDRLAGLDEREQEDR